MRIEPLDNMVWHALTTRHDRFAEGTGAARRYRPDVSVFAAIESFNDSAWDDLAATTGPGRMTVLFHDEVPEPPDGWTVVERGIGVQMMLRGAPENRQQLDTVRELTDHDVPQMMALIELTKPGPFELRTIELGGYVGVFEDDTLIGMAGRRCQVDGHVEISAVCTHPEVRRRGLGAALTLHVADRIAASGDQAMLHVAANNTTAKQVYERIGFVVRREVTFVLLRAPGSRETNSRPN